MPDSIESVPFVVAQGDATGQLIKALRELARWERLKVACTQVRGIDDVSL